MMGKPSELKDDNPLDNDYFLFQKGKTKKKNKTRTHTQKVHLVRPPHTPHTHTHTPQKPNRSQ